MVQEMGGDDCLGEEDGGATAGFHAGGMSVSVSSA